MAGPFADLTLSRSSSAGTERKSLTKSSGFLEDLQEPGSSSAGTHRKSHMISSGVSKFQEKRRVEALLRQQQARKDRTQQARQLAYPGVEQQDGGGDMAPDVGRGSTASTSAKEDTSFYAKQLMQPEWMVEVPHDLAENWIVKPRPEGHRCLVIASKGRTVSLLRNGRLLHSFTSWLPNGSRNSLSGSSNYCILDCVFHEANSKYYILDLMCWKGYALYDCAMEFRHFWLETKLGEEQTASDSSSESSDSRYSFEPVPAYQCSPDGLHAAHSGPVPFLRDGCYFLHKEGHYDTEGQTPLALFWKDPDCSRFFIDTDASGTVCQHQQVILQYAEGRRVCTADEPPIALGIMPEDFAKRTAAVLRPGRLLKFTIQAGGIHFRNGEPCGADLQFEGPANQRRGRADTCSKIIFQHLARTHPILLKHFTGIDTAAANSKELMQQ